MYKSYTLRKHNILWKGVLLQVILGVYHFFFIWQEILISHVTYDIKCTQNSILDPI